MATTEASLIRGITPLGAALLMLNGMIGAGIFVLPAAVSAMTGTLTPWLFLAVGLLFIAVALTFAELASYFRAAGGPILYTGTAFGPATGFTTGWLLWLGRITAIAANMNVVVTYLGPVWPLIAGGAGRVVFIGIICIGLVAANVAGVKQGVGAVAAFTVLKLVPLLILVAFGLPAVGIAFPATSALPSLGTASDAALLLVYAFVGFEAALVTAGETKNPRHTLPRALVITMACTALLYFLVSLVYVGVFPEGGAKTMADVGGALAGPIAAAVITFTIVFSVAGNIASAMVTAPRMTYALGENGMLPRWFAHVHARFMTPDYSILVFGLAVFALAASSSFVFLAAASSLARILVYILCILAVPKLRKTLPPEAREEAFRLPGGLVVPALAMLLCVWVCTQAAGGAWFLVAVIVAIGLVLFSLAHRRTL